MDIGKKPEPPFAGIVYGEIIYWGVWAASLIVMIGSVLAFITKANFITPSYYITLLWQGGSAKEIWEGATGHLPQEWWYLSHLANGDALVAFGISLGVFSVIPALLGSAIVLFKEKNRLYGSLALIAAIIVIISLLGLTPLPS